MTYFVNLLQNSGSDPKGNLIPAIIGGAALIGAAINVGTYVATNVGRLGSNDFNLGSGCTLFIRKSQPEVFFEIKYLQNFIKLVYSICETSLVSVGILWDAREWLLHMFMSVISKKILNICRQNFILLNCYSFLTLFGKFWCLVFIYKANNI